MKISVSGSSVYIYLDKKDEKYVTNGGTEMFITENATQQTRRGTIIDLGDEALENGYKKHDRVIISSYTGIFIHMPAYHYRDELHRLCSYDEILAHISNENVRKPEV